MCLGPIKIPLSAAPDAGSGLITSATAIQPRAAPCAGGTRVKPSIVADDAWVGAADLCQAVPWFGSWWTGFCDQILPQLVTMEKLCASVPNNPPILDFDYLARNQILWQYPERVVQWLVANWQATNWNVYCECVEAEPCPPVAFSGSATWTDPAVPQNIPFQTIPKPDGTLTFQPRYDSWSSSIGARVSIINQELDIFGNALSTYTHSLPLTPPPYTPAAVTFQPNTTALRLGFGQMNFSTFPQTSQVGGLMQFTCGEPVPPDPYVPPEPPVQPVVPPVPQPPRGCTTDDLCVQVRQIEQYILNSTIIINTAPELALSDWQDGVRHHNLREAGHLELQAAAVGVRIEVQQLPSPPRTLLGEPDFYWNMGFITPTRRFIALRGWRLVFSPQAFQLPSLADGVSWTLLDGTIMDLVELVPR